MNQHRACLYLFECISHGDSKYDHEIPKFYHFWIFGDIFGLSSALACRVESIKVALLAEDKFKYFLLDSNLEWNEMFSSWILLARAMTYLNL